MTQHVLRHRLSTSLLLATLVAIGLFLAGAMRNQSWDYWYLPYNLLLGLPALLFALWLKRLLRNHRWKSTLPILVSFLWLLFLPNSFYIVTDFIHLPEYSRVDIVQDVVMLMQFSLVGLALGYGSLWVIHKELLKRFTLSAAHGIVLGVLLICSFAIYLGRDLRWNSWDVIVQPIGLLQDVFERLANFFGYPLLWSVTLSFFGMLTSVYFILWSVKQGKT